MAKLHTLLLIAIYTKVFVRCEKTESSPPNLLVIVLDQLRWDALGFVQKQLPIYKGKLQIRTPNIDRLATLGTSFSLSYCASPSCGPARASIKTGNCVFRNGLTGNQLVEPRVYKTMKLYENRINAMVSFEQLLVEERNYTAENYGKWHSPWRLARSRNDSYNVISHNDYDYEANAPDLRPAQSFKNAYIRALKSLFKADGHVPIQETTYEGRQQGSSYANLPYEPIRIDPRYNSPPGTELSPKNGIPFYRLGSSNMYGREILEPKYTTTGILGRMAMDAMDRLLTGDQQFLLSVHFNSPHPPYLAVPEFLDYYFDQRDRLLIPPSIADPMKNSAYGLYNNRHHMKEEGENYAFNKPDLMAELIAVYYASIAEVDHWVGQLLDNLYGSGRQDNTLIIFASDHGDMLGAHGMTGKSVMLEEASRVPLIVSFPGRIPAGAVSSAEVSTMDIHATILDYLGAPELDRSDGTSLRRHIERTAYNEEYDEHTVVVEWYSRMPLNETTLSSHIGVAPSFMIRKGPYKLIVPRSRNSPLPDMFYDLEADPYEMNNLLGVHAMKANQWVIGKVEHLKILLLEWLQRHDGPDQIFSDPKYDLNQGHGIITEIFHRCTWRKLDYWQSDAALAFGRPSRIRVNDTSSDGGVEWQYVRNEYLYIGRSVFAPGPMILKSITLEGSDAAYFSVDPSRALIHQNHHVRIKVSFASSTQPGSGPLDARVVVRRKGYNATEIPLVWDTVDQTNLRPESS